MSDIVSKKKSTNSNSSQHLTFLKQLLHARKLTNHFTDILRTTKCSRYYYILFTKEETEA